MTHRRRTLEPFLHATNAVVFAVVTPGLIGAFLAAHAIRQYVLSGQLIPVLVLTLLAYLTFLGLTLFAAFWGFLPTKTMPSGKALATTWISVIASWVLVLLALPGVF